MRPASKGFTLMSTRRGPGSEETGVRTDWEGNTSKGTFPHTHSTKVYYDWKAGSAHDIKTSHSQCDTAMLK